jgi:hypothetical protein
MQSSIRPAGRLLVALLAVGCLTLAATGCQRAYYRAMESVGVHKRDLLVKRVERARDSQEDAKEQFSSALARFNSVLGTTDGDLQRKYDTLNAEFGRSEAKATTVHERIDLVEDVAEALFVEWKAELGQYSNGELRRSSEKKLSSTKARYAELIAAMKRAEDKIDPVLDAFRDQVLFLKHNLNAQAITSLSSELNSIEIGVERLIREMNASIAEADSFIAELKQG